MLRGQYETIWKSPKHRPYCVPAPYKSSSYPTLPKPLACNALYYNGFHHFFPRIDYYRTSIYNQCGTSSTFTLIFT